MCIKPLLLKWVCTLLHNWSPIAHGGTIRHSKFKIIFLFYEPLLQHSHTNIRVELKPGDICQMKQTNGINRFDSKKTYRQRCLATGVLLLLLLSFYLKLATNIASYIKMLIQAKQVSSETSFCKQPACGYTIMKRQRHDHVTD